MSIKQSPVVKTSISLPRIVKEWGVELADKKGFAGNFSNYMADLIRHDKKNDNLTRSNRRKMKKDGSFVVRSSKIFWL